MVVRNLLNAEGRDFEDAVAQAFRRLGLAAERIEETQGESDVLVSAARCEDPYGAVIECQAKQGPGQVGGEKVGQVRTHFSRYLSRFGFATKVFRCVVGRPTFSQDCIKDSVGVSGADGSDIGVCLITANDLVTLVGVNDVVPISHEDLRGMFFKDGEVAAVVKQLEYQTNSLLASYGAVLACAEIETKESDVSIIRMDRSNLVGQATTLLRMKGFGRVPEEVISRAMSDLSSPIVDLLRMDDSTVRRTSHRIGDRFEELGKSYESIEKHFESLYSSLRSAK